MKAHCSAQNNRQTLFWFVFNAFEIGRIKKATGIIRMERGSGGGDGGEKKYGKCLDNALTNEVCQG